MSRFNLPRLLAGNSFALDVAGLQIGRPALAIPISLPQRLLRVAHRYSLAVFACSFFVIASSSIAIGNSYWSARVAYRGAARTDSLPLISPPLQGPNTVVLNSDLADNLQKIASQPISLIIGDKTVPLDPTTIKSWIKVVTDVSKGVSYLHVDQSAIDTTLKQASAPFIKVQTDQITATYADGSSAVIVAGKNGTSVHDTTDFAKQIGAMVLGAKGLQLSVPTDSVPFAALTPASFDKLLEVNVTTKQMWAYEKGQLVRQFAVSAGAPATPTPIGKYQIYEKRAVQDMRGFNPDGTKYFQPHVQWINYFLPGGYAVHGNYWRPLSWFGAINSSHGCVSLPDDQAEWVYDWAPVGTTVIAHT